MFIAAVIIFSHVAFFEIYESYRNRFDSLKYVNDTHSVFNVSNIYTLNLCINHEIRVLLFFMV